MRGLIISGAAGISALLVLPAFAQDSIDVPVGVDIVSAVDLVRIGVSSEGDMGQIAQSPTSICRYGYEGGQFTIQDVNSGEVVPSPGSTTSGCAHNGDVLRPVMEISCPVSMSVPLRVGIDKSINGVEFSANYLVIDGNWIPFTSNSAGTLLFEVTCPDGSVSGLTATSEIELGIIAGISNAVDVSTGQYDVNIPVSIDY